MATESAAATTARTTTTAAMQPRQRGWQFFSSTFHPPIGSARVRISTLLLNENHERVSFDFRQYRRGQPPQVRSFNYNMDDFLSGWPTRREILREMMSCVAPLNDTSDGLRMWEDVLFEDIDVLASSRFSIEYSTNSGTSAAGLRQGVHYIVEVCPLTPQPRPRRRRGSWTNANLIDKLEQLRYDEAQFKEKDCAVCLEGFMREGEQYLTRISCEHAFHYDCIVGWLRRNHVTCPLCRREIN